MDCSKTIYFFSELKRVCDSRAECTAGAANKEQCPMFVFCRRTLVTQRAEELIRAIESLQKWSNEHPRKTYAKDFFEKFPEAKQDKDCWNEEMEAADDE